MNINSDPRYSFTIEDSDEFNTEIPVFKINKELLNFNNNSHNFHKINRNVEGFDNVKIQYKKKRNYNLFLLILLGLTAIYIIKK
jgi:hypothetical protein